MSLTNYGAAALLQHVVGKLAFPMPTGYAALFTAAGDDSGAGFVEAAGGGYVRRVVTGGAWNSPSSADPVNLINGGQVTFPTPSVGWGTIVAWGLYDALTGGNLLLWDYLGPDPWIPCYVTQGTPCQIYAAGNGYSAGDKVVFTTKYGGTQPGGGGITGLLTVASPAGDIFTPQSGGGGINTTRSGSGSIRRVSTFAAFANQPVFFQAGDMQLSLQ